MVAFFDFFKPRTKTEEKRSGFIPVETISLSLTDVESIKRRLSEIIFQSEQVIDPLYRRFVQQASTPSARVLKYVSKEGDFLPFQEWIKDLDTSEAVLKLRELKDSGLATWSDEHQGLVVSDIVLSNFPSHLYSKIGMPPVGRIDINLMPTGEPYTKNFDIKARLVINNQEVRLSSGNGLTISYGTKEYSLPRTVFFLLEAIARFTHTKSNQGLSEQNYAWVQLSDLLDETPFKKVLQQVRGQAQLLSTSCLSLELDASGMIRPVFLSPNNFNEGDKDFSSIINSDQSAHLARYLDSGKPILDHIPLGNQSYIFLTPEVKKSLGIIKKYSHGTPEERATFFANPMKMIKQELEAEGEDAQWVDSVIIETPEYLSDRVSAFGEWSRKICAFVEPIKTDWFGDENGRYGVMINGDYLWVTAQEVDDLVKTIEKAQKNDQSTIEFQGQTINVDNIDFVNLKALQAQLKEKKSEPAGGIDKSTRGKKKEEKKKAKFGPNLKSNLEELEFVAEQTDRDELHHELKGLLPPYQLYPHQQECLSWLQKLWSNGIPGSLLADDMGLGKTLQCLAFMQWISEAKAKEVDFTPALVVAPTALIRNWQEEGAKYFGANLGQPLVLTGPELKNLKHMTASERLATLKSFKWVIATYETVRDKFGWFSNVNWSLLVLDEAQKIKNPTSLLTETIKSVKADFVLAMTGTPVENSFMDLWSIIDAVVPGVMGSAKDFARNYCQKDSVEESGAELQTLLTNPQELGAGKEFPQLMLRRLKTDIGANLPKKVQVEYRKVMNGSQLAAYEEILEARRTAVEPGFALQALQQLAACSLYGAEPINENDVLTVERIQGSARLMALFDILDEIHRRKEKVLIFVQRLAIQQPLARCIQARYSMNHFPGIINGGKTSDARQRIVSDFQSGPIDEFDVAILTSKSAGVGLTLTKANHVIHLERWWNPAVEDQCSDRVYRIGQTKDVTIHIPIAVRSKDDQGSFDVKLNEFLNTKRHRNATILMPQNDEENSRQLGDAVFAT